MCEEKDSLNGLTCLALLNIRQDQTDPKAIREERTCLYFFHPTTHYRPSVSQPYTQGAVNLSGPQPAYNEFGVPATNVQQMTNQMGGMQIGTTVPSLVSQGYGNYFITCMFCSS